jgi:putative FmdB family regulatory protein
MPIYEYFCPKCEKEFELMRPFSEADKSALCPECGSEAEKLISAFASKVNFYIKVPKGAFRGRTKRGEQEQTSG